MKKKIYFIIIMALLMAISVVLIIACSSESTLESFSDGNVVSASSGSASANNPLLGIWKMDYSTDGLHCVFFNDGTYSWYSERSFDNHTYSIVDNIIRIGGHTYAYEINGNKLTTYNLCTTETRTYTKTSVSIR